ncbi:MAG: hypothetical protein WCK35_15940, partial [Chloroflexota bacterium]
LPGFLASQNSYFLIGTHKLSLYPAFNFDRNIISYPITTEHNSKTLVWGWHKGHVILTPLVL